MKQSKADQEDAHNGKNSRQRTGKWNMRKTELNLEADLPAGKWKKQRTPIKIAVDQ